MYIHFRSAIRAGGVVGLVGFGIALLVTTLLQANIGRSAGPDAIGLLLGLTGAIPTLGCLMVPILGLAFSLLPIAAGVGYGYLTPDKRHLMPGGAFSGAFGGLVYGISSSVVSLVTNTGAAAFLQDVEPVAVTGASSFIGVVLSLFVAVLVGMIFGAVGAVRFSGIRHAQREQS